MAGDIIDPIQKHFRLLTEARSFIRAPLRKCSTLIVLESARLREFRHEPKSMCQPRDDEAPRPRYSQPARMMGVPSAWATVPQRLGQQEWYRVTGWWEGGELGDTH